MKVLIAEDDRLCRELLRQCVERRGHDVVEASDGETAWRRFQEHAIQIVITDWLMPGIDGLELIRRVRAAAHDNYVYVMLLTGLSKLDDVKAGMEAGADVFLTKPFDDGELDVRLLAGERIVSLEQALAEQNRALTAAYDRIKSDVEAAAEFQKSLLPEQLPEMQGAGFAWRFRPCDELAGDILNIFRLDERHVALYLLDVAGHGIRSALLSVTLSRLLMPMPDQSSLLKRRYAGPEGYQIVPPVEVAERLNRQFPVDTTTGQYFTILYGILNVDSGEFRYVSAGQSPVAVVPRCGEPRLLPRPALPIGFMDQPDYGETVLQLASGDRLYIYSDGLVEAPNEHGEMFGDQRLLRALCDTRDSGLDESLKQLMRHFEEWTASAEIRDDVSMVTVEWMPSGVDPRSPSAWASRKSLAERV